MKSRRNITSFLLYCFGFLLLSEWVLPVANLTNTSNIWVFLAFLGISLLLTFLQIPLLVGFFIKGAVIIYLLQWLYFEGSFFQFDWLALFVMEIASNIQTILSADLPQISNMFRSLLLFILLWLMSYLLHYWLLQRRKIMLFFFLTILNVTILDTFTQYNGSNAIVRTVVVGFLVLGILTFYRVLEKEKIEGVKLVKWIIPLISVIGLGTLFGFVLPKSDPVWPDPVPYIQSMNEQSEEEQVSGVHKVGYGVDDSKLGGPFIGDDTVVFQTFSETKNYWKVEMKDVYTGKGWVQSQEKVSFIPFSQETEVPITTFSGGNSLEKKVQKGYVNSLKNYPFILYPLGVKYIETNGEFYIPVEADPVNEKTDSNTEQASQSVYLESTPNRASHVYSFEVDPAIEKIYSDTNIPGYSITYETASYSISALKSSNFAALGNYFIARYTQLPDTLPTRVKDLAVEITAGHTNRYDQAKAVEQYLRSGRFQYNTKNVLTPSEQDDYVDQFLFESMKGYCDNFSTSMVVLLRSLGIPARWVKGFTEGDFVGISGNLRQFEVKNDHAHSWVEVYFPNVGWVSFEPTPGFTSNLNLLYDENETVANTTPISPQEEQKQEKEVQEDEKKAEKSFSYTELWKKITEFIVYHAVSILSILLATTVIGFIIFLLRVKWFPFYYIWRIRGLKVEDDEKFMKAYVVLLKQLDRYGLDRKKGQTLRDYAMSIDRHFSTTEMSQLTAIYEKRLYGNNTENSDWKAIDQLWEYLIKRTVS